MHSIQIGIDWQLRDMIVWDVLTRQEPTTMTALIWDSHTGEHLADANGNILLEQSKGFLTGSSECQPCIAEVFLQWEMKKELDSLAFYFVDTIFITSPS
ncbi:MAG: hypothetical protein LUQ44_07500, partial [Methanothrix sp.]|nr:hypothetical protein [Methanothrix sp.]